MPWAPRVGELDYGEMAENIVDDALIGFFDRVLKASPSDLEPEPAVRLFVLGKNNWLTASDFPPPGTYLQEILLAQRCRRIRLWEMARSTCSLRRRNPLTHIVMIRCGGPEPGRTFLLFPCHRADGSARPARG